MIKDPLKLYRSIRRLHRNLPAELRVLGNNYMRDEFKRHQKAELYHVGIFMREWNQYYQTLKEQVSSQKIQGSSLSQDLTRLTDEQIGQLFQLKEAAEQVK